MKESLNLSANDYNNLLSITTAGYVIGQIPHGIIIQKVAPRYWLSSMVVIWAGCVLTLFSNPIALLFQIKTLADYSHSLVMCAAACKNYQQLMAVRFFQGLVEASTYCGTIYIIGSW